MSEEEIKHLQQSYYNLHEKYYKLQQENKQLKEKLEIYEIVSSTGFDKLSKKDQKEVINLVKLKNKTKGDIND